MRLTLIVAACLAFLAALVLTLVLFRPSDVARALPFDEPPPLPQPHIEFLGKVDLSGLWREHGDNVLAIDRRLRGKRIELTGSCPSLKSGSIRMVILDPVDILEFQVSGSIRPSAEDAFSKLYINPDLPMNTSLTIQGVHKRISKPGDWKTYNVELDDCTLVTGS